MAENKDFSDTRETIERASKASGAKEMLEELAKKMRGAGSTYHIFNFDTGLDLYEGTDRAEAERIFEEHKKKGHKVRMRKSSGRHEG